VASPALLLPFPLEPLRVMFEVSPLFNDASTIVYFCVEKELMCGGGVFEMTV